MMNTKQSQNELVEAVTEAIAFLVAQPLLFEYESFALSEDDLPERIIDIVQTGSLQVQLYGEDDPLEFTVTEFIRLIVECKTLEEYSEGYLRTNGLAIQRVTPVSEEAHRTLYEMDEYPTQGDNVAVRITQESFVAGFHAMRVGAWHEDYVSPIRGHAVVEVDFLSSDRPRSVESDKAIIDAYLFELAASHGVVFKTEEFSAISEDPPWNDEPNRTMTLRPLEESNGGLKRYLIASTVFDSELRFLSFFKVLEWASPTVANLAASDAMRKKLDCPEALRPTGTYIRELFELAKDFDARRNDRDQIKAVLLEATDLMHLHPKLPDFMQRELTHSSSSGELDKQAREIAECLCATRNQVAHAKTNYDERGTECPSQDLEQLNEFLREAAAQTVRWFNRLPEHRRTLLDIT